MECNLENRQNLITSYLAGELPDAEAKIFEEHYFQCEVCFKELRAVEDTINLIENEGKSVLNLGDSIDRAESLNFFRKIFGKSYKMKVNWGIAVSFAIIILAILFITLPTSNEHNLKSDNKTVIKKDSIRQRKSEKESLPVKIQEEELAANLTGPDFTPNSYLEEMSTEYVRSVNEKLDRVILPFPGEKFYDKDIIFKWLMIKNEPVMLKILTNKEKEVYNKSADKGSFPQFTVGISSNVFKNSGLYYWRIEDKDEVLYLGKFYFIKKVPD